MEENQPAHIASIAHLATDSYLGGLRGDWEGARSPIEALGLGTNLWSVGSWVNT